MKPTATGWVHGLSKKVLIKELEERGLSTVESRDALRTRLIEEIRARVEGPSTDEEGWSEEDDRQTIKEYEERRAGRALTDTVTLLGTVCKWGLQFDGKDGIAFLERLEDLRESYGLSQEQLRRCLPLFFKDQALL